MVSYSQQQQERLKLDVKSPWDRLDCLKPCSLQRRDAQEFKGGVKCPLMAEPKLCGGGCSVRGMFSRGLAQFIF
ncbi:hypothetical protein J1N35_013352 [Gossypium stocksii]|uniref:Uncharacterized protein n=1 Tax=Gossypium stocksii TaxID=47602 RepID=A0A9D3VTT4_9ROSI|nr:hypothetical protein J1N35_013352 [Gossypium stocksii]